ncbi:hypothetical protein NKI94_19270 [Mesorhizobium australicum]|uniref:hypothetical protein n=1 Tax=Mesorhizobium australicum TaxID=536018 RepID=UPI0033365AE7
MPKDRVLGFDETDGNFLCIPCLEKRLGRDLIPADFADVPVNRPSRSDTPLLAARKAGREAVHPSVPSSTKRWRLWNDRKPTGEIILAVAVDYAFVDLVLQAGKIGDRDSRDRKRLAETIMRLAHEALSNALVSERE